MVEQRIAILGPCYSDEKPLESGACDGSGY
jgi:hypothetical protein